MIKVGVVGGTGYTGVELLRLLAIHPQVNIEAVTSRSEAGTPVSDMFTSLRGYVDLPFTAPDPQTLGSCDVVFYATPNGTAMQSVPELLGAGVKVIDLAADFRLKKESEWEQWYGMPHACASLLEEAVYGLPEVNRESIAKARLVANPGCYPTSVQLGFIPLLEQGLIDSGTLIADAKSGVSGAGRKASVAHLMCEASESFKAYAVPGHRHLPEIRQGLNAVSKLPIGLTFVPHLTPMIRGIHATLYGQLTKSVDAVDLVDIYTKRYRDEFFVDVMPPGAHPETRSVKGSNTCRISVHVPQGGNTVVVLSVIDNLVKGAAGQAIQNMNIMCGFEEQEGLRTPAFLP
jgi:N-acetyl-gamma-glutamyl-phosphate reductase